MTDNALYSFLSLQQTELFVVPFIVILRRIMGCPITMHFDSFRPIVLCMCRPSTMLCRVGGQTDRKG